MSLGSKSSQVLLDAKYSENVGRLISSSAVIWKWDDHL